jgi:hypothetical protein
VRGLLQREIGVVLELPVQKAQYFIVLIALTRLFLEHVRKLFSEIPVNEHCFRHSEPANKQTKLMARRPHKNYSVMDE